MNFNNLKTAIAQSNVDVATEFLVELYISNPEKFKKSLLLSNSLPEPIIEPITKSKFNLLTKIFVLTGRKLMDKGVDINAHFFELNNVLRVISILNQNMRSNLVKLDNNSFMEYPLSQQLQMFCIFLEDQNRLFDEKNKKQQKFITGMESQVAKYEVEKLKNIKISQTDNFEGIIEVMDTLFSYLYYKNRNNSDKEKVHQNNNITPYGIESVEEIMHLALQRNLLLNTWEKFKYREWHLIEIEKEGDSVSLFEPNSKEDYLKERIAIDRYIYREHINIQQSHMSYINENQKSARYISQIAKNLDPELVFKLDKNKFERSSYIIKNLIKAQLKSLDDIYFEIEYKRLKIADLIKGYEYLFTIAFIYKAAVLNIFDENEKSHYKKLAPLIYKENLVRQFSELYGISEEVSEIVIDTYTYPNNPRLDVFSQPLIYVNKSTLIFCPSLITQMNIVRIIEMIVTKWGKNISEKGLTFEKDLRFALSTNPFIEVNSSEIEFKAYDGKNVQFDFIAKFEDQIVLIEFKHIKRPFSDYSTKNALKIIDEGIEQVNRRNRILKKDWGEIRNKCSFELPENPPHEKNVIKLICTNIFDFTSVIRNDVVVIDSSSLLKFFMSPEIKGFSIGNTINETLYKNLWEKGYPSVGDFKLYINEPVAVKQYKDCYEGLFKPILKVNDEDNNICFFDYNLIKDPYKDLGEKLSDADINMRSIKVGRNDKCPCGSGKKYKKCCIK